MAYDDEGGGFNPFANKDDYTSVRKDVLNCKQYKWNSCPKEILDFVNPIYNMVLSGTNISRDFISRSLISDFAEKSRQNGIKQAVIHSFVVTVITISAIIGVLPMLDKHFTFSFDTFVMPTSLIIGLFFFVYLLSAAFLHFHWYGILNGMIIDKVTQSMIDNSWGSFKRWYFFVFILLNIISTILLNSHVVWSWVGSALKNHLEAHERIWRAFLDNTAWTPDFNSIISLFDSMINSLNENFILISNVVSFIVLFGIFAAEFWGFRYGKNMKLAEVAEEEKDAHLRNGYTFDIAESILSED